MTEQTLAVREFEGTRIPTPGTFKLDIAHTVVGFVAKHLMISKVRGHFAEFDGTIVVAGNPLESTAEINIKTSSITTGTPDRDKHLRTADFFDIENHPTMTFRSTSIRHARGEEFVMTGDLTIRGVTKPVDLKFELTGVGTNPYGQEVFGVTASTEIDRDDWGVSWNAALESGGVVVGRKVKIEIEAEAIREA